MFIKIPLQVKKTYTPVFLSPLNFNSWNYFCPIPQEAIDPKFQFRVKFQVIIKK